MKEGETGNKIMLAMNDLFVMKNKLRAPPTSLQKLDLEVG